MLPHRPVWHAAVFLGAGVVPRVVAASRSYGALVSWSERTGAVTVDGASGFSRGNSSKALCRSILARSSGCRSGLPSRTWIRVWTSASSRAGQSLPYSRR